MSNLKPTCFLVIAISVLGNGLTADSAYGQRKVKPPVVPTVPAPQAFEVQSSEANRVIVNVDPGSNYTVQGEYVRGPLQGGTDLIQGPRPTAIQIGQGLTWLTNLVPDSEYEFRFKRVFFYDPSKNTVLTVTSPYTSFVFRTPTLAQSRPSAPSISFGTLTSSRISAQWAPSTDNNSTETQLRYTYSINGGKEIPTCSQYCFGATGLVAVRPASGSKLVVFAYDDANIRSLASNELIVP